MCVLLVVVFFFWVGVLFLVLVFAFFSGGVLGARSHKVLEGVVDAPSKDYKE
jgi:hypothetical protein